MDVIGMNIFARSVSICISPGSFPNQFNSHGANCNTAPIASNIAPSIIIHLAIYIYNNEIIISGMAQDQECLLV